MDNGITTTRDEVFFYQNMLLFLLKRLTILVTQITNMQLHNSILVYFTYKYIKI
jgi:hypothetical protein